MHVGVIAEEFPPDRGGMQEQARGLVCNLPAEVAVTLFTRPGRGRARPNLVVRDILSGDLRADAKALDAAPVDLWLALSAGTTALAPFLAKPVFGYLHGSDGLKPWSPGWPALKRATRAMERVGLPGDALMRRWRLARIRRGLRAAAGLFANSAYTRDVLSQAFGVPAARIAVIHPGIDPGAIQARGARSPGPLRLLTVTRLTRQARRKNVEGVLRAIAAVKPDLDLAYTVVGDGDERPRLEALARELGLGDRVQFLGGVDEAGLRPAYREADLFVLAVQPDREDVEGFGMVYAEAAAAGVPSLAVANGGVSEAVLDGVTGLLIQDASPDSIALALKRFAAEPRAYDPAAIRAFAERLSAPNTTRALWAAVQARLGAHSAKV